MNTANWIPDLFMKRVMEGGDWTLFSPSTCPDLHDMLRQGLRGRLRRIRSHGRRRRDRSCSRASPAMDLWRKMLIDAVRDRASLDHLQGSLQPALAAAARRRRAFSSNLCTEITLNTSDDEIAVCNLGSVNLLGST